MTLAALIRQPPTSTSGERSMPASDTHYVSDAEFKAVVLDSKEPVVVDFFAEWCGPCKAMAPALDQVATEMKGKVKVVKVDVDQSPATAQAYRIQAMPTMMLFKDGKVVDQHVGALVQKAKLEAWIKKSI
jgi:thioredoxin 1